MDCDVMCVTSQKCNNEKIFKIELMVIFINFIFSALVVVKIIISAILNEQLLPLKFASHIRKHTATIIVLNEKFFIWCKIFFIQLFEFSHMEHEIVKIKFTDDARDQIKSYQCPINEILYA